MPGSTIADIAAHSCKNNEYHCAYIHVRNVSTAAGGIYKGNAHNDSNADNSPYDVVIFALNALFFFHYHDRYCQNDKAQKQRAYLVDSAFKHVGKNAYCKKHTDHPANAKLYKKEKCFFTLCIVTSHNVVKGIYEAVIKT